jgi:hypothetical protein
LLVRVSLDTVYHAGEKGTATITGSYPTGDVYNNRRIYGFNVVIKTAGEGIIQTHFTEEDFNVYPSSNVVDYPSTNDVFTVRYLPSYPKDFVIVSDDDSPWANKLRCNDEYKTLLAARAKYAFDRTNAGYRADYLTDIRSFIARKCYTDEDDLRAYYQDMRNVRNGLPRSRSKVRIKVDVSRRRRSTAGAVSWLVASTTARGRSSIG